MVSLEWEAFVDFIKLGSLLCGVKAAGGGRRLWCCSVVGRVLTALKAFMVLARYRS